MAALMAGGMEGVSAVHRANHEAGAMARPEHHRPGELITPIVPPSPSAPLDGQGAEGLIGDVKEAVTFTQRQNLYLFVEDPDSSLAAKVFANGILLTIVASIACFVFETLPSLRNVYAFKVVEPVTTIIFSVEYLVRFFVCDAFPPMCYGHQSKFDFIRNPLNILDLLAILPFYLETAASELMKSAKPLRVLRSVRLIRCFRIFKLSKYSLGMTIMVESVLNSVQPLAILTFFLCIGVVLTSSLMYYAERMSCPDVKAKVAAGTFDSYIKACYDLDTGWSSLTRGQMELCCNEHGSALDFQSISQSFWWSVVTMTTVGYGDVVPRTVLGRLVGCLAMISGIVLISLPVAIVGSKFQLAYESLEDEKKRILLLDESEREALIQDAADHKAGPNQMAPDLLADVINAEKENDKEKEEAEKHKNEPAASHVPFVPFLAALSSQSEPSHPSRQWTGEAHGSQFDKVRPKLKALESEDKLSEKAADELYLLLEMFDHIERLDKTLKVARDRDAALDASLRKGFTDMCHAFDVNMREKVGPASPFSG